MPLKVSFNYRLGAFGWLASADFNKEGGVSNAGLLDQMAALQWVRQYIHLFGGDPDRISVLGQDSGGASILHHLAAWGGLKLGRSHNPPSFKRAIIQSLAFFPQAYEAQAKSIYKSFLDRTSSSDLKTLRELDTSVLQKANADMIQKSDYGRFTFGPTVDNTLIPAPLALLLLKGFVWKSRDTSL